jgi:hypothetical protein
MPENVAAEYKLLKEKRLSHTDWSDSKVVESAMVALLTALEIIMDKNPKDIPQMIDTYRNIVNDFVTRVNTSH